jgi:hypothetical protein
VGHEVDALGGTAGDDDLVRIEAFLEFAAARFVTLRRFTGEGMDRSVDVGVGLGVVIVHRIENDLGFLGGCCIVEVNKWMAVDLSLENRELVS